MLTSMGALEGAAVADLFAGSGALGVEALSRGAQRAVFVDRSPEALAVVRANLGVLGDASRGAKLVRADALAWARGLAGRQPAGRPLPGSQGATHAAPPTTAPPTTAPPTTASPTTAGDEHFDLVLADPPYAWRDWPALLGALRAMADVVVAETGTPWEPVAGWEAVRTRAYGTTVVTILETTEGGGG